MSIDRHMPLSKAARLCGVHRKTMRKHLEKFCGLVFHPMGRGCSPLVSEADVQVVIDKLSGVHNWSIARRRVRNREAQERVA